MPAEQLTSVADRWIEEVWKKRDINAIDELHTPDFQDRSLPSHAPREALAAYKANVSELFAAFPDFYTTTEEVVVDPAGGKIAVL